MRTRTLWLLMAVAAAAFGQRHKVDVDTTKPDGQLLQQALQEEDQAKKTGLLEQYIAQFPKTDNAAWVLETLQSIYAGAHDSDKVIAAGDKLLAIDPDDPEAGLQCLKAAEAKKDPALVKKYARSTSAAARKMAAAPQPKDADDVAAWKSQVDYAKQVDTYTEYALYSAAATTRDPKVAVELGEMLRERNPSGEYGLKVQGPLFLAYRQVGANDKAIALAEAALATDQSNEDMLLAVADNYLQNKREADKVHAYSVKVVELMTVRPKPEGVSDADWTTRKNLMLGLGHYMNGKQYWTDNQFPKADQELRSALPLVESSPQMKPEVLYLLADANYKMQKPQDAANFYRACAALKSPYQATAAKNLRAVLAEYHGVK